MKIYPVQIWKGSHTVHTAWLLKQHQTKEAHRGLNTNILVMSLLPSCFYNWLRLYLTLIYFAEADTVSFPYIYAAIFLPLMCAFLAGIISIFLNRFVKSSPHLNLHLPHVWMCCFCSNRNIILPKIPEPRDLLSGIPDNNFMVSILKRHQYFLIYMNRCGISLIKGSMTAKKVLWVKLDQFLFVNFFIIYFLCL